MRPSYLYHQEREGVGWRGRQRKREIERERGREREREGEREREREREASPEHLPWLRGWGSYPREEARPQREPFAPLLLLLLRVGLGFRV
jgi:hypothetical protein